LSEIIAIFADEKKRKQNYTLFIYEKKTITTGSIARRGIHCKRTRKEISGLWCRLLQS
jgi:hypothetical protein